MTLTRRGAMRLASGVAGLPLVRHAAAQGSAGPAGIKRGGVLTSHLSSEQRILNPALRASTGVYIITSKMVEGLVDLDASGKPAPVLATGWEAAPDGKTVTFHLRDGVQWHDGKPFTAADVQYSAMELWKKYLNYGACCTIALGNVVMACFGALRC